MNKNRTALNSSRGRDNYYIINKDRLRNKMQSSFIILSLFELHIVPKKTLTQFVLMFIGSHDYI